MSRKKRAKAREAKWAGYKERRATRSNYAAKVWEREHGQAPRREAEAEARKSY